MDDFGPSQEFQKITISGNLNSTLMFLFLFGLYSGVYIATMYTYFSTRSSYSRIITSTVSALYAVIVGQACIQWYYMNFTFVSNGDSRQSLFNLSFSNPSAACIIASNVLGSMGLLLADGLLMWRCFHTCGSSLTIGISIAFLLYILEVGMTIADVTFESMLAVKPNFSNPGRGRAYNIIDGTLSGLAVVTSSTATLIIARSIYSSTHKISKLSLRAQYTQISNIIVQSSMIYSLFLLGNAICDWLLSTRSNVSGSMIAFTNFLLTLNIVVTGVAPTIMVARLTVQSLKRKDIISDIETGEELVQHVPQGHENEPFHDGGNQVMKLKNMAQVNNMQLVEQGNEVV